MSTWKILTLETYPQSEGQQNVVFTIDWQVYLSQDGKAVSNYGSVGVQYTQGSPFTPFNELTEEQVVGWVKAALGDERVAEIEAYLQSQLNELLNPTSVVLPPPWSN
jgi:hypothetical protein